jgi:hypothetical protein
MGVCMCVMRGWQERKMVVVFFWFLLLTIKCLNLMTCYRFEAEANLQNFRLKNPLSSGVL